MNQTLRLFVNNKRISTAVYTKNGAFLQVYPVKKTFSSEAAWRANWETVTRPEVRVESPSSKVKPVQKSTLSTDNWTYKHTCKVDAPPGQYYIGDLCYVLGDQVYDKVFGGQGYESGLYTQEGGKNFFLVDTTAYGDGLYVGSDQREFAVDAGIIGITPVSCMEKNDGGGQIYTFSDPVECRFKNGHFLFRSGGNTLVIDTIEDNEAGY